MREEVFLSPSDHYHPVSLLHLPQARSEWPHYYPHKDAIIFVVDSTDTARLPEARRLLHATLKEKELGYLPLLVMCTKSDLEGALSSDQMVPLLGLDLLLNGEWYVQSVTAHQDSKDSLYKLPVRPTS